MRNLYYFCQKYRLIIVFNKFIKMKKIILTLALLMGVFAAQAQSLE